MKTTRQNLVLATAIAVAAALGLSACNKNDNSAPDNVPPAAMSSAQPAMPPVSEPPPMGSSSTMPAQPATAGSVGTP